MYANQSICLEITVGDVGEPLKIDLLQPLASARLVLHPYEAADLLEFGRWHGILSGFSLARKPNCPMVTVFKFSEIECGVNSGFNLNPVYFGLCCLAEGPWMLLRISIAFPSRRVECCWGWRCLAVHCGEHSVVLFFACALGSKVREGIRNFEEH